MPAVYGHPSANLAELIDGGEDALLTRPQQLAARVKKFPPAVKGAMLRLLKRINTDTERVAVADGSNPGTDALNKKLNDNMRWVEQEVNK